MDAYELYMRLYRADPEDDEIVLGLGTLLLANWKDRNKPADAPASGDGNPPIDSSAKRG